MLQQTAAWWHFEALPHSIADPIDTLNVLLEVLRSSDDNGPLQLVTGELSLENLWGDIRSNIGRRKRAITFVSWLQYFTHGVQGDYPIDWSIGEAFRE